MSSQVWFSSITSFSAESNLSTQSVTILLMYVIVKIVLNLFLFFGASFLRTEQISRICCYSYIKDFYIYLITTPLTRVYLCNSEPRCTQYCNSDQDVPNTVPWSTPLPISLYILVGVLAPTMQALQGKDVLLSVLCGCVNGVLH